jgi:4-hydroxyphenylpyruvate dioxygenase-like putative hemolysin
MLVSAKVLIFYRHIKKERKMTDIFENPLGLDGFEFVEFASPERGLLEPVFELLGFSHVANHIKRCDALSAGRDKLHHQLREK